jgi:hypothetical protein
MIDGTPSEARFATAGSNKFGRQFDFSDASRCLTQFPHQYLQQLSPEIRHSVLGNIGTIISFRIGAEDAPYITREFHSHFSQLDRKRQGDRTWRG